MADMRFKENKSLLARARERYKVMAEDDRHNREDALEDIRFVNLPGAQWNENMKTERGDRPCYEYNKTRVRCKRVVNDMRDNRPSGKVRGVEGDDKDVAEIYEGLIRNIWNVSHGDNATDYAAEYQVEGGMGAWRVNTDYADDSAFEQDVIIEMIENPFSLYADPSSKDLLKRDARDWIFTTRISHDEFAETYGKNEPKVDFESDNEFEDDQDDEWTDEETVRIAEYWYQKPHKKELWLLEDGTVVDSESDEARGLDKAQISKKREVETKKIMMVICSGERILEGPVEWAGTKFPWVMVYGEYKVIEGRAYWWGLPRFAKDAQRNYNISKTAIAETIAQAPKGKWWATSAQAAGHVGEWAEADRKNFPYLLYEADPQSPGPPQRMGGADVPVALLQQAAVDNEDLKDVMGLPDSSMGQSGDEKSGRAIYARQQQGEIATFNYRDNMAKAVEYTMELLIDLIPNIYDTERELRILGQDGAEDYKRINQVVRDPKSNELVRVNDLAAGKYDVTVTTGPAFSTQRQEAAEMYMGLTQGMPEIMGFAGDLIFKAVDLPYSEEIADRLKAMLPPQIQQMLMDGQDVPPEVQQMMMQAEQAMAQVQEYGELVQAAAAELEESKAEAAVSKAELDASKAAVDTAMARLKQAEAEFRAEMSETLAGLTEKKADLITRSAGLLVREQEVGESADTHVAVNMTGKVDDMLAEFMTAVDNAMGKIDQQTAWLATRATRKPVGGTTSREGGKLTANVEFDDGSTESLSAVKGAGGLKIVPAEIEPEE
jgi:hypothetical protein